MAFTERDLRGNASESLTEGEGKGYPRLLYKLPPQRVLLDRHPYRTGGEADAKGMAVGPALSSPVCGTVLLNYLLPLSFPAPPCFVSALIRVTFLQKPGYPVFPKTF